MSFVHHIAFNCRDKNAQEAFYVKHFGFRRVRIFNEGLPKEFVMLRLGTTCLELFQAMSDDAPQAGEQPVGFKHFAFEVDDFDAKVTELRDAGVDIDDIRDVSKYIEGLRVCFLRDPEGNIVELIEGYTDA